MLITADTLEGRTVTSQSTDMTALETDSNNSLNEATEKTLKLDVGMDSSNPDDSNAGSDIQLSSPEKPGVELGEPSSVLEGEGARNTEEGLLDVGRDFQQLHA